MADNVPTDNQLEAQESRRPHDRSESSRTSLQQGGRSSPRGRGRGRSPNNRGAEERSDSPGGLARGRGRGRSKRPDMQMYVPKGKRPQNPNGAQAETQVQISKEKEEVSKISSDSNVPEVPVGTVKEPDNGNTRKIRRAGKTYAEVYVPKQKRMQQKPTTEHFQCESNMGNDRHSALEVNRSNNMKRPKSAGNSPKAKVNNQIMQRNRKDSKSTEDLSVEINVSDEQVSNVNYDTTNVECGQVSGILTKETANCEVTDENDIKLKEQTLGRGSHEFSQAQTSDGTSVIEGLAETADSKSSDMSMKSQSLQAEEVMGATHDETEEMDSEFTPHQAPKDDMPCRNDSQESHSVIRCYLVSSTGQVGDSSSHIDTQDECQETTQMQETDSADKHNKMNNDDDITDVEPDRLTHSFNTSEVSAEGCEVSQSEDVYLSIHSIQNSAKSEGIYCAAGSPVCSVLQACQTVTCDHVSEVIPDEVSAQKPDHDEKIGQEELGDANSKDEYVAEDWEELEDPSIVSACHECKPSNTAHSDKVKPLQDGNNVSIPDKAINVSQEDPSIVEAGVSASPKKSKVKGKKSDQTNAQTSLTDQDPCVIKAKSCPKSSKDKKSSKKKNSSLQDQDSSIVDMASASCDVVSALDAIFGSNTSVIPKSHKSTPTVTASKVEPEARDTDNAMETDDAEVEDDWENMFNDDGDALGPKLMEELTVAVGKVKVQKPKIDYHNFQPREPDLDYEEYNHLIEIYEFPKEHITSDLLMVFTDYQEQGFDIKWVDDTHAIGVFASTIAAQSALDLRHPLVKVRPISQATRQTKLKAKKSSEFLQPYKPRPETTAAVARKLVSGALGLKTTVPKEKREEESRIIKEAKEKKKEARKQKQNAWDGKIGKCAMDEK